MSVCEETRWFSSNCPHRYQVCWRQILLSERLANWDPVSGSEEKNCLLPEPLDSTVKCSGWGRHWMTSLEKYLIVLSERCQKILHFMVLTANLDGHSDIPNFKVR
ncbi:hypothetical protein HispidOSU_029450 [Sigmodon hispidus]